MSAVSMPSVSPFGSGDLRRMLDVRYAAPEWLLCDEAGGAFGRRVDVVAFNLWHSRGYGLEGFEMKVDRRDWVREMRNPAKAEESLYGYCDRWWLLTSPGVAQADEIPEPWGWIESAGERLMTRKKAPILTPKPITRAVMAALMKRYEAALLQDRDALRRDAREAAYLENRADHKAELDRLKAEINASDARVREVERRFGWATDEQHEQAGRAALSLLKATAPRGVISEAASRLRVALAAVEEANANLAAALQPTEPTA